MKRLLAFVLVLVVAGAALGYWRGWFSVNKEGKGEVQVDPGKFQKDRAAFSKTVGEKAKAFKEQVAGLWKKSKELAGDDKAHVEKELAELGKKHERIEKQLKDLEETGQDKFEGLKQDLSKSLEEVEHKIGELSKKLEKTSDK